MPRKSINYENTVIYGIFSNDITLNHVYVGHTTDVTKRESQHKTVCNNVKSKDYNTPVYQTIRANGGWENFAFRVIEIFSCESRLHASARENHYYQLYKATMNTQVPNQTPKERYNENRDQISEYQKQYRNENKDQIAEQNKQNYKENKDKILEQRKQYLKDNKEEINAKRRQKRADLKRLQLR